jgi:protein involved in polysaccharide export with SLBB domain
LKNVQYLLFFLILLPAQTWGQDKAHLIGSQDVLTLSIYAGGELQREVDLTVSDENMVNIPFIGQVKAEKLTISELVSRGITVLGTLYRWKEK